MQFQSGSEDSPRFPKLVPAGNTEDSRFVTHPVTYTSEWAAPFEKFPLEKFSLDINADLSGSDDDDDEVVGSAAKYTGPFKQLWTTLLGKQEAMNLSVIHKQLDLRQNELLTMFTNHTPPDQQITVGVDASLKDKLITEFANKWNLKEDTALDIVSEYIIFEYKGLVSSLNQLLGDPRIKRQMWNELNDFYLAERLCKIYCAQIILCSSCDKSHPYNEIFVEFLLCNGALKLWLQLLCESLDRALNDEERVELLHALAILLANHCESEDILELFVSLYKPPAEFRRSKSVLLAEAVLMYAFLQCGDDDKNHHIQSYLDSHCTDFHENKYIFGAYVCAFKDRCSDKSKISDSLRQVRDPLECVQSMVELLDEYDTKSFRNKHGIGGILVQGVLFAAETILSSFIKELFGSSKDWLHLFCALVRQVSDVHYDPKCSKEFIDHGKPNELFDLFEDYSLRFPVDSDSILECWRELVRGGSTGSSPSKILEKLLEITALSEVYDDVDPLMLRPNRGHVMLMQDRYIGGVLVRSGTLGTLLEKNELTPKVIVWNLTQLGRNYDTWDVLTDIILKPIWRSHLDISKETLSRISTMAEFVISFCKVTDYLSKELMTFSKYIASILLGLLSKEAVVSEKCRLIALYVNLLHSISSFDYKYLMTVGRDLWPSLEKANLIGHYIMTFESVTTTNLEITRAFLKAVVNLFRKANTVNSPFDITKPMEETMGKYFVNAVHFIRENILPAFIRWRISSERHRFSMLRDCLRVFCNLFSIPDEWKSLKNACSQDLLAPESPLLYILKTDEHALQESIIRPNEHNSYLPQTVHLALKLVANLITHDKAALAKLDNTVGLTIVQKLARMVRHRVNVSIPTLAMVVLKKFAEESQMSIRSCLGDDLEPFCDTLLQRLEYKSEDTQLKVTILDFIAVCLTTQRGLVAHFLMDDTFIRTVFDLLSENDGNLVTTACDFIRTFVRRGNPILKKLRPNMWGGVLIPLKKLSRFSNPQIRQNIITSALHIMMYELYRYGLSDQNFAKELENVFDDSLWEMITEAALGGKEDKPTLYCLQMLKHFLVLVCSYPEFDLPKLENALQLALQKATDAFWYEKELKKSNPVIRLSLSEIILVLLPSKSEIYLDTFCQKAFESYFDDVLPVQITVLACMQKCIRTEAGTLSPSTVEHITKIVCRIFDASPKLLGVKLFDSGKALVGHAARTAKTLLGVGFSPSVPGIFLRNLLLPSVFKCINVGLRQREAPTSMLDCLVLLVKISEKPETRELFRSIDLTHNLWTPIVDYGVVPRNDLEFVKWSDVYISSVLLNNTLLKAEKYYYLGEALHFWGLHSLYLSQKLIALSEIVHHGYIHKEDSSFEQLDSLLVANKIICDGVAEMLNYVRGWRSHQGLLISKLMESILPAMQGSVTLLLHPNNMLLILSKYTAPCSSSSNTPFKLTHHLLEMQSRFWDFIISGINVYWCIKQKSEDYIADCDLVNLLYSVLNVGCKAFNSQTEKKSRLSINDHDAVLKVMHKCFTMLLVNLEGKIEHQEIIDGVKNMSEHFKGDMAELMSRNK